MFEEKVVFLASPTKISLHLRALSGPSDLLGVGRIAADEILLSQHLLIFRQGIALNPERNSRYSKELAMGRALQSSMAEQQKRSSEMTQEEFLEAQAAETVRMCGATGKSRRFEMLLGTKEREIPHRAQLMVTERLLSIVPHLTRNRQRPAGASSKDHCITVSR